MSHTLSAAELDSSTVQHYITSMKNAYNQIDDYQCIFKKQERVNGKLLPQETILLKFKRPFSIYMKWIKEPHKDQEILYVRGWNDGKLRAHPGSFPDITVNLNPTGSLAMRENRHPVTEAGIGQTIKMVSDDYHYAMKHPQDSVKYYNRGTKMVEGRKAQCFEAIMPMKEHSPYYAYRAVVCIDDSLSLPSRVIIYDKTNTLVEDYFYTKYKLNIGLTKKDFQPDNPNYNF